jgi:NitT/TauT family transport system substrate-binding protein
LHTPLARIPALIVTLAFTLSSGPALAQDDPVIHVAVSAFEAHADVYYAQELGLFKTAGLNVDIQQLQGGSAVIAGIIGGALQIGAGNPLPVATAHEKGLDLVLIAPGFVSDAAFTPVGAIVVAANSPLKTGSDLNGKTVAVNALHSIDEIAVDSWVDKNGGDSHTIKFVETSNIVMVEAVAAGRIDAAMIADPGLSTGLQSGRVRLLARADDAIAKRFMVASWFTSRTWADHHPDTARKFAAILNQASDWAIKNPEAAAAVLQKYLRLTTPQAHERRSTSLDPALLQPLFDAAVRYHSLPKPLDARDIIWH